MEFYKRLDEQGRFLGLKIEINGNWQEDSHTYSYVEALKCELDCANDPNKDNIQKYYDKIFKES